MSDSDTNIAKNRQRPVPDPKAYPAIEPDFQTTPVDILRKLLRRMPSSLLAEGVAALREAVAQGDKLKTDFANSPKVPGADAIAQLADRLENLQQGQVLLQALEVYYKELEQIALSDARVLLEGLYEEYEHFVKRDSTIKSRYPKLIAFHEAIGDAIREGRKEADRQKKESKGENK